MENNTIKMKISGMHCPSCKVLIEDVLNDEGAKIKSFVKDELEIETQKSFKDIKKSIENEGYKVELKK